MSLAAIDTAVQQEQGFPMHLTDVPPRTDLRQLFGRWAGDFQVQGPSDAGTAVVTFSSDALLREALAAFGGGLRGAFQIDRRQTQGK
jgi:hypothetical protein